MTISLTPQQHRWLESQVTAGHYSSVDEAARAIIEERMAVDGEGVDWVKPLLDEARASIAAGAGVPYEQVQDRLADRIRKLNEQL